MASKLKNHLVDFYYWLFDDNDEELEDGGKMADDFMEEKGLTAPEKSTPEEAKRLTLELRRCGVLHSCLTCIHFDHTLEMCGLAKQRPPAEVIANGCPSWDYEELPF